MEDDEFSQSVLRLYQEVTGRNEGYDQIRERFLGVRVDEPLFWGDWRDEKGRDHLLEDEFAYPKVL